MNEVVVNKTMKRAALGQPATTPTARSAFVIHTPRCRGAIGPIDSLPTRQFPPYRTGRATEKPTNALLAIASIMLGENHATFLAAEVLASSVHRNILCPVGGG